MTIFLDKHKDHCSVIAAAFYYVYEAVLYINLGERMTSFCGTCSSPNSIKKSFGIAFNANFKKNMLAIIFNGGWMVMMRLHLGATHREGRPVSLKYGVSLKGLPYHIDDEIISL